MSNSLLVTAKLKHGYTERAAEQSLAIHWVLHYGMVSVLRILVEWD